MSDRPAEAVEVLRSVWASTPMGTTIGAEAIADEDCGPTKSCRNMKDVSFDGFAPEGTDLREAWRQKLAREGKLSTTGDSIRDLVLGPAQPRRAADLRWTARRASAR